MNVSEIRELCESSLHSFITVVDPKRLLGSVHREVIDWWCRPNARSHSLTLLPRDHQKSALLAYRIAWEITKRPDIRILYISSTSNLATKQLNLIKQILTSTTYRTLWPSMINKNEATREKWTETEISVDHPKRKREMVRDPTVFTAGLTTNTVGLHCDVVAMDDVVVDETAYEAQGREKLKTAVSYLASVASTDAQLWAVGTRYHPLDLYNDFILQTVNVFDIEGNVIDNEPLFETFERQVESNGDGTGEFLWPRTLRPSDGKPFGFNREILAKKKAQYFDLSKFRAQYYNNPNDESTSIFRRDNFQYYERKLLRQDGSSWYFGNKRLNVYASIDFAYSLKKSADWTCIVVVGVDASNNIYVLEIDRFKTQSISEYYDHILKQHVRWGFRKLRAEITAAQEIIVEDLKNNYIRPSGLAFVVDGKRPTRNKEERILAALEPKYGNKQVYHYKGGNCELLEEELMQARPSHDDIKDALASVVEITIAPTFMNLGVEKKTEQFFNKRFGGIG